MLKKKIEIRKKSPIDENTPENMGFFSLKNQKKF